MTESDFLLAKHYEDRPQASLPDIYWWEDDAHRLRYSNISGKNGPHRAEAVVDRVQHRIIELLKQETENILKLGLPECRVTDSGARLEDYEEVYDSKKYPPRQKEYWPTGFRAPEYKVPAHFCLRVDTYVYLIFQEIEKAKACVAEHGLLATIKQFPGGKWFYRDPYRFHRQLNDRNFYYVDDLLIKQRGIANEDVLSRDSFFDIPFEFKPAKPLKIDSFTEVTRLVTGLACSRALLSDTYRTSMKQHLSGWATIPRPFMNQGEAMPCLASDAPRVCLQIIPSPKCNANSAANFFSALHQVKEPFYFDVVADAYGARLEFTCAANEADLVEHHFESSLREFTVVRQEAQPDPLLEPVVDFRLFSSQQVTAHKNLNSFSLDPYSHLFAVIKSMRADQWLVLRVMCVPFSAKAINAASESTQKAFEWFEALGDFYEARRRAERALNVYKLLIPPRLAELLSELKGHLRKLEQIKSKFPCWAVATYVGASDSQLTDLLSERFWPQYQVSSGAGWESAPAEQWHSLTFGYDKELDRLPWALMSSAELAALAHFPDISIHSGLLKTVTAISGPPPLYTKPE